MTSRPSNIGRILEALEARELRKMAAVTAERQQLAEIVSKARLEKDDANRSGSDSCWTTAGQLNRERRVHVLDRHIILQNSKLARSAAEYEMQRHLTAYAVGRKNAFEKATKQ